MFYILLLLCFIEEDNLSLPRPRLWQRFSEEAGVNTLVMRTSQSHLVGLVVKTIMTVTLPPVFRAARALRTHALTTDSTNLGNPAQNMPLYLAMVQCSYILRNHVSSPESLLRTFVNMRPSYSTFPICLQRKYIVIHDSFISHYT